MMQKLINQCDNLLLRIGPVGLYIFNVKEAFFSWWLQRLVWYFPYVSRSSCQWIEINIKAIMIAAIVCSVVIFLGSLGSSVFLKVLADCIGLGFVICPFLAPVSRYFSDLIFEEVLRGLRRRLSSVKWERLDEYEAEVFTSFCNNQEFRIIVENAIRAGKQGLLVGKKEREKKSVKSEHKNSPCMRKTRRELPRKILVSFHSRGKFGKEGFYIPWMYWGLDICFSVFVKTKLAGGEKEQLSRRQTASGGFKVCHYTEYVRASEDEENFTKVNRATKGVALRNKIENEGDEGIYHQYSIQKSAGEALSRAITRLQPKKIADKKLLDIFEQVKKQLEPLHEKGFFHGDIKASNIVVCDELRTFTVIDFPSLYPHSKKTTKTLSLLSLEHEQLINMKQALSKLQKINIESCRAVFHDTWATLCVLKTLSAYTENPRVSGKAVTETMEKMIVTLKDNLDAQDKESSANFLIGIMNTQWNMSAAYETLRENFFNAEEKLQNNQKKIREVEERKFEDFVVLDIFLKIKEKLKPYHDNGRWHGAIREESICVEGDYEKFEVLDPRQCVYRGPKHSSGILSSLQDGVLSLECDLVKQNRRAIAAVIEKLEKTGFSNSEAIYHDTWATLCVIKEIADLCVTKQNNDILGTVSKRAVIQTMVEMICSLNHYLGKESISQEGLTEYMCRKWDMDATFKVLSRNFEAIKASVNKLDEDLRKDLQPTAITKGIGPPLRSYTSV